MNYGVDVDRGKQGALGDMNRFLASPLRNLALVIGFMLTVTTISTLAYMLAGWPLLDAFYMVVLTVYTVGYGEVHPIHTAYLHAVTIGTIVFGCTGMIFLTGALVQIFTASQIQQILGATRMKSEIDHLKGHVIVCGFGRIGVMLAQELTRGRAEFVILEREDKRYNEARDMGYLCVQGDATDEAYLLAAGVSRARVLATVLPNDAANVFITLSARNLNPKLQIIARGEAPSTGGKLMHAGADTVVLPTHIGAERIAELILFPETARLMRDSERMREFERTLGDLGLQLEALIVEADSPLAGQTVAELERRGKGAFFVVQVQESETEGMARPPADLRIKIGDRLVVVGKTGGALSAALRAPAERIRAGRTVF
ncbi:MAG: potassium channel protein [Caulobacteraceae bacterium]|nr:potassium channel protein [Caulobacteraceae bacterium]